MADTKMLYGYNFVAPLINSDQKLSIGNELNSHANFVKITWKTWVKFPQNRLKPITHWLSYGINILDKV